MKKYYCILLYLLAPVSMFGMSEQWQYACSNQIVQFYADGAGGCAFVEMDTNDVQTLTWLDKKGTILYQTGLTTNITSTIVFCTKKQLAFRDANPLSIIRFVDKKGQVTTLEDPGRNLHQSYFTMAIPDNLTIDSKGFFGFKFMINQDWQVIIRYKNK
jgi:hypothetical protein